MTCQLELKALIKKAIRLNTEHQSVQKSPIFNLYLVAFTFFLGCNRYQIFLVAVATVTCIFLDAFFTAKMFLHRFH